MINDYDSPIEECRVVLIPAEKTREETNTELNKLSKRIEEMSKEIPSSSREIYYNFRKENKEKRKIKK